VLEIWYPAGMNLLGRRDKFEEKRSSSRTLEETYSAVEKERKRNGLWIWKIYKLV
jgi:hypothetical protein